jgi:hypothetical protein
MDFKDWRHSPAQPEAEQVRPSAGRFHGRRFSDYIEEQIHAAEERGAFRNVPGMGQPLNLDVNPYAGEKAAGYRLLKNNGCAPVEIELAREIRQKHERLAALRASLIRRGRELRHRQNAPSMSERRVYNAAVHKALAEYEAGVRELNSKILTLNLSAPAALHRPSLDVEQLVTQFRELCPLL